MRSENIRFLYYTDSLRKGSTLAMTGLSKETTMSRPGELMENC
jgi:hypothetical protein